MALKLNSDESGPVAEINITPLVDVMLVLLVIFMITAPLMENGIPIELPKASTKAISKGESPTILSLTKEGGIYINHDPVPANELKERLMTAFKAIAKKEIFIRADGALPYAAVAQAMATVKNAGIHRIGLITLPAEKKN